jgi:hypothetical protein
MPYSMGDFLRYMIIWFFPRLLIALVAVGAWTFHGEITERTIRMTVLVRAGNL